MHLRRRFTPYNVHTLIECDARRSAAVGCAHPHGCSSPFGGFDSAFYRFSGAFCMRVCPQGFGVCRARPCAASASAPAPHRIKRREYSLYCASSRGTPSPMSSAASSWCRCRRSGAALFGGFCGGTPQSLHIYHVLRSDTSFKRFRGIRVASRGALKAPRTAPFWARLRPPRHGGRVCAPFGAFAAAASCCCLSWTRGLNLPKSYHIACIFVKRAASTAVNLG